MTTVVKAMRHESSFPVLIRPGVAAPSLIIANAELADVGLLVSFTVRVANGGTIRVHRLNVQPLDMTSANPAITSRALRSIRLDELARQSVRELEQPVSMREDYAEGAFQMTADPDRIWASTMHMKDVQNPQDMLWVSRPVPGRRRTSREQAELAARVYAEAVDSGSRAPTQAVANELGYSRSQASRMIRTARDLGLLGKPTTSVEAAPTDQGSRVKPEAGPSIFRDPNGPRPWEENEGNRPDANDQDD